VHKIVTTPGVDPAEADAIREMGIELIIAEPRVTAELPAPELLELSTPG
jgi:hypothetical protein